MLIELKGMKTNQPAEGEIPLNELCNETFMSRYSAHDSFESFLSKGNFAVKSREDIRNIPDELFDNYISRETSFKNWDAMLDRATAEYEASR